jgi:hypothetical protein
MNLVHEPVHVPVAMSRSQLTQPSGCGVIFGLSARRLCCNKKLNNKNCRCVFRDIVNYKVPFSQVLSYSVTNVN